MAIIPGKKNFTIQRRADFPIKLTFKDSTGSAISLNGYTVEAQVYDESRSTKYYLEGKLFVREGYTA